MHINNTYVYQGGPLDLNQLFSLQDVTLEARAFAANEMDSHLSRMWDVLRQDEVPDVETGPHCTIPYQCPFLRAHCSNRPAGKLAIYGYS